MQRLAFLVPAAIAGAATSLIAVSLRLDATPTYALLGAIGLLVVGGGIIRDLRLGGKVQRSEIVKMHESAIRAEQDDSPPPTRIVRPGVETGNEERGLANNPVIVATRRAGIQVLVGEKLNQRVKIRFSHEGDPTLKQPV